MQTATHVHHSTNSETAGLRCFVAQNEGQNDHQKIQSKSSMRECCCLAISFDRGDQNQKKKKKKKKTEERFDPLCDMLSRERRCDNMYPPRELITTR